MSRWNLGEDKYDVQTKVVSISCIQRRGSKLMYWPLLNFPKTTVKRKTCIIFHTMGNINSVSKTANEAASLYHDSCTDSVMAK